MGKWDQRSIIVTVLGQILFQTLGVLGTPGFVLAQGPGQTGAQVPFASGTTEFNHKGIDPRSISDPAFNKCDHNCLYNKANENITLQVDYILRKHQYINDDTIDEHDRRAVLGGFCRSANSTTSGIAGGVSGPAGDEDFDDCRKRWNTLNNFWLLKTQTALSENEGSKAKLAGYNCKDDKCDPLARVDYFKQDGRYSADYFQTGQQNTNPTKFSQAPAFSKANDLAVQAKSAYEKLQKVSDMSDDQLAKALARSLEPQKEDFIEFMRVQRDPTNGGSEFFEIPRRTADGQPVYNEKAYRLAMKKYEATFGKMKDTGTTTGTILHDTFSGRSTSIKNQKIQNLQKMERDFKEPASSTNKSEPRQMYDDARDRYVEDIRKQMGQPTTVNFPGNQQSQRSVSKTNPANPTPNQSPKYNGTLDVPYQQVQQTTDAQGNKTTSSQDTYMSLHATQFNFVPEGQSTSDSGISIRSAPSPTPTSPGGINKSAPVGGAPSLTGSTPAGGANRSTQQKLQQVQDNGSINLDFN